MKRYLYVFGVFFFLVYTFIGFIAYQASFPIVSSKHGVLNNKFYDYAGITHVHTESSTGSGTLDEVISAAATTNCHFLVITDLNNGLDLEEVNGYRKNVLVIRGGEYSFLSGHILGYDLPDNTNLRGPGQNQIFFNERLNQKKENPGDGFLIAAHPFLPHQSWTDMSFPGLHGMEVLNLDSIWSYALEKYPLSVFWSILILPFNSDLAYLRLFDDASRELRVWDQQLSTRSFVGFAGNDTRANVIPYPGETYKIPSYQQSFKLLKNHVILASELTGSYREDREKIMGALKAGSFYMSLDVIGNPSGFYFLAEQNRKEYLLGRTVKLSQGPIILSIDLGIDEMTAPFEVNLFRDGQKIHTSNTTKTRFEVNKAGSYRVEVRVIPTLPVPDGKKWIPWIYTNAIRVI